MNLTFYTSGDNLLATYRKVRRILRGQELIIFEEMAKIQDNFSTPSEPSEYEQKHRLIERIFERPNLYAGRDKAFLLMEGVWKRAQSLAGIPGVRNEELLGALKFETNTPGVTIGLTERSRWRAEWVISLRINGAGHRQMAFLELFDRVLGEIVPTYVVDYVHGGLSIYEQGRKAVALALLSIAVEATLRDVLATRGYSFKKDGSPVDVYKTVGARIGVSADAYTVRFDHQMPKSLTEFGDAADGAEMDVTIRRTVNRRNQRVDLSIVAPGLIDFWSDNQVEKHAEKRVSGLGAALRIARRVEGFLTAEELPEDLDEVITTVRNNLIHLSGSALATPLMMFDPSGAITLNDFIEDPEMVYDLVREVPSFINRQYIALREAGLDAEATEAEVLPFPGAEGS